MSGINDFVQINIRLETGGASVAGFGVSTITGPHAAFAERTKSIASLSELEDAGIDDDHGTLGGLIYNAAKTMLAQKPKPASILIGRVQVDVVTATILEAVEGREYKATVNDVEYSYTAVALDTTDLIATGLAAAIDVDAAVTAVALGGATGEYTVTADVPGTYFGMTVDDNQTAAATTTEDFDNALTAVEAENAKFYGVVTTTRDAVQQEKVADWTAASVAPRFNRTASNDVNIANIAVALDTTSLAAVLKAKSYITTEGFYHTKADGSMTDEYIDAGMMAVALGFDPDVTTATDKFQVIRGVTPDKISTTQRLNILGSEESPTSGKNFNIYTSVNDVGTTASGITSGGEWADIIFGADWLKVRTEERIFRAFTINPKIPYTQAGIAAIVTEIRAQLKIGQNTGFLAFDPDLDKTFGYLVTFPQVSGIPSIDKANRILKSVSFAATAAGAIHAAKPINGTLAP